MLTVHWWHSISATLDNNSNQKAILNIQYIVNDMIIDSINHSVAFCWRWVFFFTGLQRSFHPCSSGSPTPSTPGHAWFGQNRAPSGNQTLTHIHTHRNLGHVYNGWEDFPHEFKCIGSALFFNMEKIITYLNTHMPAQHTHTHKHQSIFM